MLPSFGTIFSVPLVNDRVTYYEYVPPKNKSFKALLVSDCHLGAKLPIDVAINIFIDALSALINRENATVLFILGDVVDGTQGADVLRRLISRLEKLRLPVYAIGGNHDREFFANIKVDRNSNVTIAHELSFMINIRQANRPNIRVFMAHDLLNNYRVRDPHAYFFATWIKEGARNYIKPDDWLIIGHTHTGFLSHASRVACIGQFSPEIRVFGYGTLELDEDLVVSVKNSLKSACYQ